MRFNRHVSIREEDDGILLYQSHNTALVRLTVEVFSAVKAAMNVNVQDAPLRDVLTRLETMGFFESFLPPRTINAVRATDSDFERGGYFRVKSRRAPISVLWETTSRCNLACPYCFPNVKAKRREVMDLPTRDMLRICDQLIACKAMRVTLTGGEALLRDDIFDIASRLASHAITASVITNGIRMNEELLSKLRGRDLYVAVSLDGHNEEINRATRGPMAFPRTIETLGKLRKNRIPSSGICTVTRHNFTTLAETIRTFRNLGVHAVTLQDLRPFGSRETYDAYRLTPGQEAILPETLAALEHEFPDMSFMFSELLHFGNPLNPTQAAGELMECPAGEHGIYIDVRGEVYPCTNYKLFSMGNLVKDDLADIWQNCTELQEFRRMKALPRATAAGCGNCERASMCRGGCRGDAFFYSGDMMGPPPRCPKLLGNCGNKKGGAPSNSDAGGLRQCSQLV